LDLLENEVWYPPAYFLMLAGQQVGVVWDQMLNIEYYQLHGWDIATSNSTEHTINALGLKNFKVTRNNK